MIFFYRSVCIIFFISCIAANNCYAQNILQKKITVSVTKKPVSTVLASIEKQAGFFFSYNNNLFNADSLVTIDAKDLPVSDVLNLLFGKRFKYRHLNNHLIISENIPDGNQEVKGFVLDKVSGEPVPYVTVYERNQLAAAMTDEHGAFKLVLKKRGSADSLSVSRVSYSDTIIPIDWNMAQNVTIKVTPIDKSLDSVIVSMMAQRDWLMRNILSYKQMMNSINLNQFFVKQPFQFSIVPSLSSRGRMSSQMVNNFSFNILGGYNGGVNGLEIGGLYNITNRNVQYVQIAGLFNVVGGHAKGVQIAGLFNRDSSVRGFQVAGIFNQTMKAQGFQVGGLVNRTDSMRGFQVGGIFNQSVKTHGFQVGGIVNRNDTMQGFQVSTVNLNHKFKGVQIGVINVADTIEGIPIGLINLGKEGINSLSMSYNEMGIALLSYKSGNPKLYNILTAGSRLNMQEKAFAFGYGLGKEIPAGQIFYINPELTSLFFLNGNRAKQNISARLQLNLKFKISKSFSLYAGPSVTALYSRPGIIPDGYKADLSNGMHNFSITKNTTGWLGWNVGINLF
jgi:hypothetical protein